MGERQLPSLRHNWLRVSIVELSFVRHQFGWIRCNDYVKDSFSGLVFARHGDTNGSQSANCTDGSQSATSTFETTDLNSYTDCSSNCPFGEHELSSF